MAVALWWMIFRLLTRLDGSRLEKSVFLNYFSNQKISASTKYSTLGFSKNKKDDHIIGFNTHFLIINKLSTVPSIRGSDQQAITLLNQKINHKMSQHT